jgi:Zn finger protein HypA/HybF involved in hydrogenase expression|tara:strand:+ start:54 stop:230 length:177 start_codon:yes stop_codon:yes gene_type:complete
MSDVEVKINISENLNQCMTCDHTGNKWAEHPKTNECVCPVCLSTDFYIIEERADEIKN